MGTTLANDVTLWGQDFGKGTPIIGVERAVF